MKISNDEVKHIALLSRLKLTEREISIFREQLSKILTYMDTLNELDTKDIETTSHVLPLRNVFRNDKEEASLDRKTALSNAPDKKKGFYRVPKIID